MPRKKLPRKAEEPEPADRHKPSRQCRIPLNLARELDRIAEEEWTTFPTQVVLAIRYYIRHKSGSSGGGQMPTS